MKKTLGLTGIALAAALALPAAAQTVLKFSHTDQQAGARQAAAAPPSSSSTLAPSQARRARRAGRRYLPSPESPVTTKAFSPGLT